MSGERTRSVLVVDDEAAVCDSLAEFLADFGYECATAASAEEAITRFEPRPFDAVIVDLRLPGMSGEALIAALHRRRPETAFLIHTGAPGYQPSAELQTIGIGADQVFMKPQRDLQAFDRALRALLSKREP